MNTNTGQIYTGPTEISEAFNRGEPLVSVSQRVAGLSRDQRIRVGNVIAQLKRTHPNLTDEEREARALRACKG